jgi:hypothetical protein
MKNKLVLIFGCIFLAFISISLKCKGQNLKYLYLEKNDAITLANAATGSRIVFQFFYDASGNLTLYAWPKKFGSSANADTDGQILKIGKGELPVANLNQVLFANLHIAHTRFKDFKDKCGLYAFTVFIPHIDPIDGSGIKHVYYEILGTNDSPTFKKALTLTTITTTKNPSPPHNSY